MSKKIQEYWFIAAPGNPTLDDTWNELRYALRKYKKRCRNYRFYMPKLNAGTFEQLVFVSEELTLLESTAESMVHKFAQNIDKLIGGDREELTKSLKSEQVSLHDYVVTFKWDVTKYPKKQSVKTIAYMIKKQLAEIERKLFNRLKNYTTTVASFTSWERKRVGNLLTKYLGDYVSKDDFIKNSDFLTTVIVAVPSNITKEWERSYELLNEHVVPRSTSLIAKDDEYAIYSVTLFKKAIEKFTETALAKGFTVRDCTFDENEIAAFGHEFYTLLRSKRHNQITLLNWCTSTFSECFKAMVHIKASKIYVESILRYGLDRNILQALIIVDRKSVNAVRKVLRKLYKDLDYKLVFRKKGSKVEEGELSTGDYFPYVYSRLKVDINEILAAK